MIDRRLLLALMALGLTGCWTEACVRVYPGLAVEFCQESLSSLLDDPSLQLPDGCALGSCASRGFTTRCGDGWVRPVHASLPDCQ